MEKNSSTSLQYFLLIAILVVSALFMFNASSEESATMDELAHIPAGYGYAKYQDYRLNPEHPPLIKAGSAIPLLFADVNFPDNHKSWTEDVNGQWDSGAEFLYFSGNDADEIISLARIFPILITLLTSLLVFIWGKELLGGKWALLATALFAFSPVVMGQGHYVTTDLGATFGVLLALFAFVSFLLRPSAGRFFLAGIALGVAELLKFSNVLLFPIFLILAGFFWLGEMGRNSNGKFVLDIKRGLKYLGVTIGIFAVCFVVIYLGYLVTTMNYPPERQVSDTVEILSSMPGTLSSINIWMAKTPGLRPLAEYFLGILMVLQRSSGGNNVYFLGDVASIGWWYYFPVIFFLKEPIPILLLILMSAIFSIGKVFESLRTKGIKLMKIFWEYLGTNFPEFSMLIFCILYWMYSIQSPLNIGYRHLLPTAPLILILAVAGIKNWINATSGESKKYGTRIGVREIQVGPLINPQRKKKISPVKTGIVAAIVVWFLFESFSVSPYFTSYFNQLGGGTFGGYRYATDSNYDWGQDLKRLTAWVEEKNKNGDEMQKIEKIAVDYFGGGRPEYYLGDVYERWWSALGNPKEKNIEWIAISVNTLSQVFARKVKGFEIKEEDSYTWLTETHPRADALGGVPEPDIRIGTSIFVYHL